MIAKLKKIGLVYVVFALGFFTGVFFVSVWLGMYGYRLDGNRMPEVLATFVEKNP